MKNKVYYELIYKKIVDRAKARGPLSGYIEHHHIIPRCMGGTDDIENIVPLTPEEHYVCHQLLVKIYPNHLGLWRSVYMMSYVSDSTQGRRGNKLYGWLKRKNKWKERVTTKCSYCSKEIISLECQKRKFCSRSCKHASFVKQVIKTCKRCKVEFSTTPYNNHRIFCTPKCSSLHQKKTSYKKCLNCKEDFFAPPHILRIRTFCSNDCSNNFKIKKLASKPCLHCGDLIYGKLGRLKNISYCSKVCRKEYRAKRKHSLKNVSHNFCPEAHNTSCSLAMHQHHESR